MPADPVSEYAVGVMTMDVEGKSSEGFNRIVEQGVRQVEAVLDRLGLRTDLFAFEGPHLTPAAGAYAPLDFLEIGIAEKLERKLPFLLVVTEVDLSSSTLAYTLALPSQLTNVGIVSTKRLDPGFWGDDPDPDRAAHRLSALLLHTLGHLLNLRHSSDDSNVMHPVEGVEDLDGKQAFTDQQQQRLRAMLPRESHDTFAPGRGRLERWAFVLKTVVADAGSIGRAVARAHPFRLVTHMPTMIAAGLSVIVVLLFSAETWDVAGAATLGQAVLFSVISLLSAAFVLYRAFAFDALLGRDGRLAESTVVTTTATMVSLGFALVSLFLLFGGLMYFGVVTVFPERLMAAWSTGDPATSTLDHVKLSLFLAAMGVLAGSLGGRSDSRDLVRSVLFLNEES
ncbi:hypothetical protein [Rubrivirga sp.]|uniref:hypothetical protein n=1 Tax=Rubrivirga sp. TaxID=1885344 RepID=UPI003C72A920